MCLYVSSSRMIADKDITCWKLLERKLGKLRSIYYHHEYEVGILNVGDLNSPRPGLVNVSKNIINKAFHSFGDEKEANLSYEMMIGKVLVKCTIPKDSEYYEGLWEGLRSYASNQLIVNEIVKETKKLPTEGVDFV